MPTQRLTQHETIEIEVGPRVGRILQGLERELSASSYRHVLRRALLEAALQYADRLGIDRRLKLGAIEELSDQLKAEV